MALVLSWVSRAFSLVHLGWNNMFVSSALALNGCHRVALVTQHKYKYKYENKYKYKCKYKYKYKISPVKYLLMETSKLECVQLCTVLSRNNCVWLLLRPIYVLPLEKGSQRLSLWFSYYDISFFLLLTFGKIVFNINVCHSSMLSHDIRTRDLLHTIYQIFQYQRLKITLNGKCKKKYLE